MQLRPFQREDVDFLKQHDLRALVASAPGTGKTPVTVRALVEHKAGLPALIVCPASVTRNWAREIRRWAPGVQPIMVDDLRSKISTPETRHVIYIVNWSLLDPRIQDLKKLPLQTIVADEAHNIKNPDAQRSMSFVDLAQQCKGVLLLTGTPIVNTHEELTVLKSVLGTEQPPMLRRLIEDVAPDIPRKRRAYIYVRLRPEDQKEYDRADQDFETWLRKEKDKLSEEGYNESDIEKILAAEAFAKIGYLRRMVGEFKVHAAVEWISRAVRLGEPVVVFVEHQAVIEGLTRGLRRQRIRFCVVEGATSAKKRQEYVDAFQNHQYPVFIGSKAAKEGITLTAARHLLFVERYFTAADEEQAEDRIRRIGQTHETTIWFLHADGTVDDRIDEIVKTKRQIVRTAIGAKEIMETPASNVEALLHQWGKHARNENRNVTALGHGEGQTALPRPSDTHAVVFYGARWREKSARIWCQMNGYLNTPKYVPMQDRFKLVFHPAELFVKGQFEIIDVSKDIRVIAGKRLSKANERKIRSSMRQRMT